MTEEGTFLNVENLLKDTTAALLGGNSNMVPDEALVALKRMIDSLEDAAVQIAFGTYIGAGKAGESEKNVLTFDFVPLFVAIVAETSYSVGLLYAGQIGAISTIDGSSLEFEQTGTSLHWWSRSSSATQMDINGTTYVYRAIGLKEGQA